MLSELDGFLTGIAIGPELIRPSEWLPLIWGGAAPEFAGLDEANTILGSLMVRYNEILRDIADDTLAPIFWVDRNSAVIADGLGRGLSSGNHAARRRVGAAVQFQTRWQASIPILSLCCDKHGDSLLSLPPEAEDRIVAQAPELIAGCVIEIATYWRRKGPRQSRFRRAPNRAAPRPKSAATIRVLAARARSSKGAAAKSLKQITQRPRSSGTVVRCGRW